MDRQRSRVVRLPLAAAGLLALGLTLVVAPPGRVQEPAKRAPVPSADAQAKALALIKEIFEEEYKRAEKDPAARQKLAAVLLGQVAENDDPASRFVLLREAQDQAARAGDAATALYAVEDMARLFAVDALALRVKALALAQESARSADAQRGVVEGALEFLDDALAADRHDDADRLAATAHAAATRAGEDEKLLKQLAARRQEVAGLKKAFAESQQARKTLEKDPTDAAANLTVGRYLALGKGDWTKGLPLLKLGSDGALKELAGKDLGNPGQAKEQADLGDGWWSLTEKEPGWAERQLMKRALYWYDRALPGLSGLTRTRVEKRTEAASARFSDLMPPPAKVGELLRMTGHVGDMRSVAFSRDGRQGASGGQDTIVRVWDLRSGKQLQALKGATAFIVGVAWSPDGRKIASGGDDKVVHVWDARSGKVLGKFTGHTQPIWSVAWLPDSKRLISGGQENLAILWDMTTNKEIRRFQGHTNGVRWLGVSRDGRRLVTGSWDNSVRVWDVDTGKQLHQLNGHTANVFAVAVSPDGRQALSGGQDSSIILWDIVGGKEVRRMRGHNGSIWGVSFAPNGRRALSSGSDGSVRLWDLSSGKELQRFEHGRDVWGVAFGPDGRRGLSTANDSTVRLWGLPR